MSYVGTLIHHNYYHHQPTVFDYYFCHFMKGISVDPFQRLTAGPPGCHFETLTLSCRKLNIFLPIL